MDNYNAVIDYCLELQDVADNYNIKMEMFIRYQELYKLEPSCKPYTQERNGKYETCMNSKTDRLLNRLNSELEDMIQNERTRKNR